MGIVSMGDLGDWLIASREQTIQHLQNYIAGAKELGMAAGRLGAIQSARG